IRRQPRRPAVSVVDPNLDEIHFFCGEFPHCLSRFIFCRYFVRDSRISCGAWSGIGCTDTASRNVQHRSTESSPALVSADLVRYVSFFDALRLHGRDPEVQRSVQIAHDRLASEVICGIGETTLKSRMAVRVNECRHDRLAGKVNTRGTTGRTDGAFIADPRD